MKLHNVKKNTILYCMQELRAEELASEKKSIESIQKFESYRKHKMRDLEEFKEKSEHFNDFEADLLNKIDLLEGDLMKFEMSLQDALDEAATKFKDKILANINDMA